MATEPSDDELLESIIHEFTTALRAGQHPTIQQYQDRYPHLADEIADVLSSISMIELFKSASASTTGSRQKLDNVSKLTQIGPYKILKEIGRGGMGVVFAAIHESLGRQVAIKVMPTPLMDGETHVQRFRREAQAAARLHHTNIVSVFEAGEGQGYHYYVMDFVDGESLNQVIDRLRSMNAGGALSSNLNGLSRTSKSSTSNNADGANGSTSNANSSSNATDLQPAAISNSSSHFEKNRFRWAAKLAAQMADALSHAHSVGILHRDIKPSNMILDSTNRIWITDFGLAKDISQETALTRTGDVVGTPQYLPPESLELKYDVRSEVYGIGLVLYEMLALKPAYTGSSPAELIAAIASKSPTPLHKILSDIPRDLATIVDKCIAREPAVRYATAGSLHRDLVAFLEDRTIAARRPSAVESAWRWARRNPLAATLSATSAVLLALVAVSASVGYLLTTSALRKLRTQQSATSLALEQSEQNYQLMKSQYDRAESNVALSIEAFDEMFMHMISRGTKSTVDLEVEGLREISGVEPSLTTEDAAFLDRMVKFYEQFATLNAENVQLEAESAKAYRRVGNIYQIVGQPQKAIEAYEKSLKLLPTYSKAESGSINKEELLTRVRTQNELSSAHRMGGALVLAQEWSNKSIRLLEGSPLVKEDREVRLELARTKSALGFDVLRAFASAGRLQANRPLSGDRGSVEPVPGGQRPFNGDRLGQGDRPNLEAGKRLWERVNKPLIFDSIKILDELVTEAPDNGEYIALRASCYWCLAAADLERDQANQFENRNKAISALDGLVKKHPQNSEYQYLLALACSLTLPGADKEEQKLVERGAAIAKELVDEHPNLLDYHHLHAKLRIKLASIAIQQKERERAYEGLQSAKRSIMTLVSRASSDRSFALTMNALIRELVQLEKLYRDEGNIRVANEISQILRQIHQTRRPQ